MKNHEYLPFWLATLIPLVLILFLIITSQVKESAIKTAHDFIYMTEYYSDGQPYQVKDGQLVVTPSPTPEATPFPSYYPTTKPQLYQYSACQELSRKVTLEEVQRLTLNGQPTSPDGYQVTQNDNASFGLFSIFFGSESERGYYLKSKKGQRLLDLGLPIYGTIEVLGWVTKPSEC